MKDKIQGKLDATPAAGELFCGIGGNYNSINQVINELIDNAWSNITANNIGNKTILISVDLVEIKQNSPVKISIEDNGTGFRELSSALRVGDKNFQDSDLNEHGFGLVQALSAACPNNTNWTISTRTRDEFSKGVFRKISAPYQYNVDDNTIECPSSEWNGSYEGSGSVITVVCSYEFFLSIAENLLVNPLPFDKCLDYLVEEISHRYSGKLKSDMCEIVVKSETANRLIPYMEKAKSIKPEWIHDKKHLKGRMPKLLDGNSVILDYEFGLIYQSKCFANHYKANMATNGVEIRLNGRLFMNNVFSEIWHKENHPDYNKFYGIVDIISEDRRSLPRTKTDKSGIRIGDKMLAELYKWIAKDLELPIKTRTKEEVEKELVNDLIKKLIEEHDVEPSNIKKEFYVFQSLDMPSLIDLYLFNKNKADIFEAKKSHAKKKHLYQLEEYWDGAVLDGKELNTATLIVSKCDAKMYRLLRMFNSKIDATGCHYNFYIKTWSDFGIDYKAYMNE